MSAQSSRSWFRPKDEDNGLRRVLATLLERWWVVVLCVLLCTAASLVYVSTAAKVYRAQSNLLITPVPSTDPALSTLGLIRQSPDPTRDVETAAQLVTTPAVAARVNAALELGETSSDLLAKVRADPVAQSDIVTITASASSARGAQRLASAFAGAAVAERTAQLHAQLDALIPRLKAQAKTLPRAQQTGPDSLGAQITELQTLRQGSDPTMRVETLAQLPTSPASPRKRLSVAAGVIAGLILGIGGALALQLLDPRLRREEQLREEYLLPVLTRIPRQRGIGRRGERPLLRVGLGPAALEGYGALRTALSVSGNGSHGARSVLVTGPSVAEGKTTTAINLAASLASTGQRVALIDADHRRPTIARALGLEPEHHLQSVLAGEVQPADAMVRARQYGPHLDVLAGRADADGLLAVPDAAGLLERLEDTHDWIVIDAPPLNIVADVLPLARVVDHVVFVVRVGRTKMAQLAELGEFAERHGIQPSGFVLVGVDQHDLRDYSYR